ncbi:fungal-specific transcription factor domain-containing protein [Rhodofomes roseus]|uniref:Fungal-specific transcription factor domain-containing protein n=1 Tax=Rhodofomes roseus TaxID=34475 RepID=A0ABQ8K913_9APHY|nr:fungal-specific transcription factor domain-containing protein [Rhodofomes roseus]KAH9833806.1 fungal-specific transcription factor domain-containing protein [Rhodofomes roseus]
MPLQSAYSEPSDDERLPSPSERQPSVEQGSRRRSTRACDQCRRTKSKCERDKGGPARKPCRGCIALGLPCTYAGPSHKRGPPKGYILAIERRLHQVEALLGTIIGSEDQRARGLIQDLSQDELARQIIQRVDVGPFGPKGRVAHPFGSTKEDFLASIMTGAGEEVQEAPKADGASPRFDNLALVSPSSTWQDSLQRLLPGAPGTVFPQAAVDVPPPGNGSPDHRTRRASFPLMSNRVSSPWRVPAVSPMNSLSSLTTFPTVSPAERVLWDNIEGLEKIDTESTSSDESELKVPARVEDVYIDGDAQLRIANRVSGLQILNQCRKVLTGGGEEKSFDCPWPSTDAERAAGPLPTSKAMRLPPEQHQHELVRAFFEHVYPAFPVVNKGQFLRLYHQKLSNGVQVPLHSNLDQASFDVLLLSMFALSYRFINTFTDGLDYVAEAERLLSSLRGRAHTFLCQAWLLLAYRNVGIGCLEAGWMHTGLAIRMAQGLGLHRDTQGLISSGLTSEEERVARQQVWAGCIIADRHLSVLLGRPTMIDPADCDVPPIAISQDNALHLQTDLGLGSSRVGNSIILTCFNASRALAVIIGAVIDQLYAISRPTDAVLELRAKRLEHQLSHWQQTLPAQVQVQALNTLPPACVLELHIRYWWTVILLYRSFVQAPLVKDFYSSLDSIRSKALALCRDASTQLSALGVYQRFMQVPSDSLPC